MLGFRVSLGALEIGTSGLTQPYSQGTMRNFILFRSARGRRKHGNRYCEVV
jgi:hypothetical protein